MPVIIGSTGLHTHGLYDDGMACMSLASEEQRVMLPS